MTEQTPWESLDDASLGRLMKRSLSVINEGANRFDKKVEASAALLLCCIAANAGSDEMVVELGGVTEGGKEFGDWVVVVSRCEARDED